MIIERRLPKHRLEQLRDECVGMIRYCVLMGLGDWRRAWENKLAWVTVRIAAAETRRGM